MTRDSIETGPSDGARDEVRREAGLIARISAGAGVAAVVAVPFLVILALVVSEADALARIDRGVANALNAWTMERSPVVTVLEVVERITSPWAFRLAVLLVAAMLWRAGSRRLATWAVTTMAVGGLLNLAIKAAVARARPTFDDPVASADFYSFPSGHAQNSMMGVAVLMLVLLPLLSRRGKGLAWAAGVLVIAVTGFDRVALGVHYLSDVVAGWVAAAALVAGTSIAFGVPHRAHATVDGLDETSSRRLQRAPDPRGERAPAPAGVPELVAELRSLVGRLLLVVAAAWGVLVVLGLLVLALDDRLWPMTVDEQVVQWLAAHRTPTWNSVTHWMSWIVDTKRVVISLVIVSVALRLTFGRWRESAFVVAAVSVEAFAFVLTTAVVGRNRPETLIEVAPPTSSFPSGHFAAALALYGAVALALSWHTGSRWRQALIWVLLLTPPLCVGYARLYRGAHFPSDLIGSVVVAGAAIAMSARLILFAALSPQLRDVLDSSFWERHAPIGPEPQADSNSRADR